MTNPRWEAFQVSTRAIGIDLKRSQFTTDYGNYVASPTTTFRAGMLVQLASDQTVELCDGTVPYGFAKYNKTNTLYASVVGEYIQLNGTTPTNLLHANLFVPGTAGGVRVGVDLTGTPYTEGGGADYTVNYVNGQITRVATGAIPDGGYVYVNYSYQVTEQELQFEGRNFWNFINDVDIQNGLITVINDWSLIFTTMYDPAETYAVNDTLKAGAVGDNKAGLVTKSGAGAFIGKVFQPPTADDPYLGVRYVGGLVS